MNSKGELCIGMAGAGRATELHMEALIRGIEVPVCFKHIIARRMEQVMEKKEKYGFINASLDFEDLINDEEIDVIDICTPPYIHEEMIIKALEAGKHVICEKPLSGYFGKEGDRLPIGDHVSKEKMYHDLLESLERVREAVKKSGKKFMYAENFIYAPAVIKTEEIIRKKGSRILYAKGEESLKGSSSPVAGEWSKTGGGTFIRTGAHPLAAILHLKHVEGEVHGTDTSVKSVFGDMGRIIPTLTDYEKRHIAARPQDVEDLGTVIIEFADGTRANIVAADVLLGGSKNRLEFYCNDTAINCTLTMNDLMTTYFLDEDNLDDVFLSEMLPAKTGWNNLGLADEYIRGYLTEMRDFMEAIYFDRDPRSPFELAYDVIKVIYAAYYSAEKRAWVDL